MDAPQEFLQLIGPAAVAHFNRVEAMFQKYEAALDQQRRDRARRLIKPKTAADMLDMDTDTLEHIPEIRWHLPNEPRRRRVFLVSVEEYIEKYEATSLQLHQLKSKPKS